MKEQILPSFKQMKIIIHVICENKDLLKQNMYSLITVYSLKQSLQQYTNPIFSLPS